MKKIAIVGAGSTGSLASKLAANTSALVVVEKSKLPGFEINGITYIPRERSKQTARASAMMSMLAAVSAMYSGGGSYSRQRPDVNIIEEFSLIQAKKSKLSRSDRDWVCREFHRMFKEAE